MKSLFKYSILAASLAFAPLSASAASCSPGTCLVVGEDGQSLATDVRFTLVGIVNDAVTNSFTFMASFINDTGASVSDFAVAVQNYAPTVGFGTISNLILSINGGTGVQLTDADGFGIGVNAANNQVDGRITIGGIGAGETVSLALTGDANPDGFDPNIQISLSAVPVPAGGLLLLSALGAGAFVRRRKSKAA